MILAEAPSQKKQAPSTVFLRFSLQGHSSSSDRSFRNAYNFPTNVTYFIEMTHNNTTESTLHGPH